MLQVDPDLVPPTGVDPDASEADSAREGATPRVVRKDLDVCLGRLPARANRSGLVGQGSSNIDPRSDASEPCRHHTVADNKVFSSHRMGIQLPADAIETLESRACQDQSRAWHIQPVDEAIIEVLVVAQRARLWRRTGLEEGGETLADECVEVRCGAVHLPTRRLADNDHALQVCIEGGRHDLLLSAQRARGRPPGPCREPRGYAAEVLAKRLVDSTACLLQTPS
mmetsp:Transcript_75414/g.161578  ORF Transcript_75414/g.161578 Transcript_75414/m.161578 type:complete len:225 (-) Transcript_75414:257-931(-)